MHLYQILKIRYIKIQKNRFWMRFGEISKIMDYIDKIRH